MNQSGKMLIRRAGPEDAEVIAEIHIASWRQNYRGILPDNYLDHEAPAERHAFWQACLARPSNERLTLLALGSGTPAGFAALRFKHDAGYDVTLDNIHITKRMQNCGLGRALMAEAARAACARGCRNICLWVFDHNKHAIAFYDKLEGQAVAHGFDDFKDANAAHTQYAWTELPGLIERCRA